MFIYALRATTLKLFGIVLLAAILLVSLAVMIPVYGNEPLQTAAEEKTVNYTKIKTNDDRLSFLKQFGWEVQETPEEEEVRMPSEFDRVFASYNEIQKRQGLDLTKYAGRKVMRYTYKLTNWQDGEKDVYATVIVYKNRIIGGDLCSPGKDGFVLTLEGK
ncbi:MAG: DUF4830 domain-containing protein [Clostridia bacterium]|nr:DUF4830 domain-containing protein [Clostridia bacterium]